MHTLVPTNYVRVFDIIMVLHVNLSLITRLLSTHFKKKMHVTKINKKIKEQKYDTNAPCNADHYSQK